MADEKLEIKPILFPYSYLTEDEKKGLFLLLPELHVLRLFRSDVESSDDYGSFIKYLFPVDDEEFLTKLSKAISEDQNLVFEHTDGESVAIWEEIFAEEIVESAPFQLVTQIRGRFKRKSEEESTLWQNAYLLQLGIELEKQGIELLGKFSSVKKLESEFKEVLGVEGDERLELLEGNYDGIVRLWEYRDSSLSRKIRAWCYFSSKMEMDNLLPVVISKSVNDEIEILMETIERDENLTVKMDETIVETRDPAVLSNDEIAEIRNKVKKKGEEFLSSLLEKNPEATRTIFEEWLSKLDAILESVFPENYPSRVKISLLHIDGISLREIFGKLAGLDVKLTDNNSRCFFLCVYPGGL